MFKHFYVRSELNAFAWLVLTTLSALTPSHALLGQVAAPLQKPVVREIFVPFEDLNVLLDSPIQRVFLTRKEYEELLSKVKKTTPELASPRTLVMLSAEYEGKVEEGRAQLTGKMIVDVLSDGLHALALPISGAGLLRVTVDGEPAPVGLNESRQPLLFLKDKGRKNVELKMVAPLETTAALQSMNVRLPAVSSARLKLSVPGNVDVKSGASVLKREVDQDANITRFDLLLVSGNTPLVMTLNNRQLMKQRAVVARSVIVDEVTKAYERLHATVSLGVLHGAIEQAQFQLPIGFEVTSVASPLLSRWVVEKASDGPARKLTVTLREPTTETVVLNLSAIRTPVVFEKWQLPRLQPLDVAGEAAVVGLLVEDRLKADTLVPKDLIPIDTAILSMAFPESVFQAEPGSPQVRTIAAYFAPQAEYELTANFTQPAAKFDATTNLLLVLDEKQHQVRGTFTAMPHAEKLFSLDFSVPADWQVQEVTNTHGQKLPFETYNANEGSRVRVQLLAGLQPGVADSVNFRATHVPKDWLANWREMKITFPVFAVIGAAHDEGALAVHSLDDLKVRPDQLDQLVPLDETEKGAYGLEGITTDLVYRYENQPYSATFQVRHLSPEITARTFSFFRVETERLFAHYEIAYEVRNARIQTLAFSLPIHSPRAISVSGLDGVVVKEYNSEEPADDLAKEDPAAGLRVWTVSLADQRNGRLRLQVEFEQSLPTAEDKKTTSKKLDLPRMIAGVIGAKADEAGRAVQYSSGLVAVEGNAELDVQVAAPEGTRKIDVGELAEADFQVGRHLLVAYGFTGDAPQLSLNITRRPGVELPTALVQRAELVTFVSASGRQTTAARYQLRTKALLLEIRLPHGAQLWSVQIDGKPISPQRDGDSLLLSLTAIGGETLRDLQLVYEQTGNSLAFLSRIESSAPRLFLRDDHSKKAQEVPMADVRWNLSVPAGYRVVGSSGTVSPDKTDYTTLSQLGPRTSPWVALAAIPGSVTYATGDAASFRYANSSAKSPARHDELPAGEAYKAASSTILELQDNIRAVPADLSQSETKSESFAMPGTKAPSNVSGPQLTPPMSAPTTPFPAVTPAKPTAEPVPDTAKLAEAKKLADKDDFFAAPESSRKIDGTKIKLQKELASASELEKDARDKRANAKYGYVGQEDLRRSGKVWALEGVRSLPFDFSTYLNSSRPLLAFESLGADPRLQVQVTNRSRLKSLGLGLALLTVLGGLVRISRPTSSKFVYIAVVLAIVTIVPLVLPWEQAVGEICDYVFWAAWSLVPIYLIVGISRWTLKKVQSFNLPSPTRPVVTTTAAILLFACALSSSPVWAEKPSVPKENENLVPPTERVKPVKVPDDAVIFPYNADDNEGVAKAEKVMVPLDKYNEIWRLAFPDKRPKSERPPVPFTFAGATYTATLDGKDFLTLRGQIELELFTDDAVDVPLALQGGVLAEAKVDGEPARLRVINTPAVAPPVANSKPVAMPQQKMAAVTPAEPKEILALVLSGKGRKGLEISVRLHLERRGGWRIAEGRIPTAIATALTLTAPDPQTEIRLTGVLDRLRFETTKAGEQIETALRDDQPFSIQWRPKVGEGEVDKSLTARSQIELEARDDALRVAWQVTLDFARSRRENFSLEVPANYLVERVMGGNVRGWQARKNDERQKIDITLLKAIADTESFTVYLSRRGRVGTGELANFPLPVFHVTDAALHQGTIAIRRSPLLELRIHDLRGLSRTDASTGTPILESDAQEQSVLVSRPFQTYRFQSVNYAATLSAAEVPSSVTARLQSVLRITDRDTRLESLVNLKIANRPLHQIRVQLPSEFAPTAVQLRSANGAPYDWAITDVTDGAAAGQKLLTIQLTAGASGNLGLMLEGTLGRRKEADPVPLPKVKVLDVTQQEGDVVVQVDPAVNVTADQLKNCESVLLGKDQSALSQRFGWLSASQRDVSRLAIRYRTADYDGVLKLTRRQPRITCFTVTNIRVTTRAIEETIGLDFQIEDAGVREVSFLLPAWMRGARVNTRLLRQSIVEDVAKGMDDTPDAQPQVRFRLEFQDEVMGKLQVVVQNDRLLSAATQKVPIPTVETGRTDQRLIALESAGRGEVVFDQQKGVEPLTRQQQPWRKLTELFGDNITVAYSVLDDARQPLLTYRTKDRALVETAAARIGVMETEFQLDNSGAYRARVTYRVDNSTEPFLVVQIPAGASLWTVRVAEEPVKPTEVPGGAANQVRIPLVKTAPGDADYPVVLTYAGRMAPLSSWQSIRFPFVKTVNINVEISLVRLLLPADRHWFDFGGSMTQLPNVGDYKASYFEYQTKQIQQLSRLLQSNPDELTTFRCASNLKQLGIAVQDFARGNSYLNYNDNFNKNLTANSAALQHAQEQLEQQVKDQSEEQSVVVDNRERLNGRIEQQQASRAKNVVGKLGRNFDLYSNPSSTTSVPMQTLPNAQAFNPKWFDSNKLAQSPRSEAASGKPSDMPAQAGQVQPQARGRVITSQNDNLNQQLKQRQEFNAPNGQPQLPNAAPTNEAFRRQIEEIDAKGKAQQAANPVKENSQEVGRRYQQRLEVQDQQRIDAVNRLQDGERLQKGEKALEQRKNTYSASQPDFAVPTTPLATEGRMNGPATSLGRGANPGEQPALNGISNARQGVISNNLLNSETRTDSSQSLHLASLDIDLPQRGTEYFFKTPRGEIEITVQQVSRSLTDRLIKLLAATAGLAVVSAVYVGLRRFSN